jgi:ElaB/YqjD/DUF883 family membrane-anchored ribosome-binding protein
MSSPLEHVKNDLEVLLRDTQALLQESKNSGAEQVGNVYKQASGGFRHILNQLQQLEVAALTKGNNVAEKTNHYVHEKPWVAVGLAGGVGALLGWLLTQRK